MRRFRLLAVVFQLAATVVATGNVSADHEPIAHPYRFDAFVTTETATWDPDGHSVGLNRVSGTGLVWLSFSAIIDCEDQVVVSTLSSLNNHYVVSHFDEDITDGYGVINPTDWDRQYGALSAVTASVPPSLDVPYFADVRVRIVTGRFHRLGTYMDLKLTLDIRVSRAPGTEFERLVCESDVEREPTVVARMHYVPDITGRNAVIFMGATARSGLGTDVQPIARLVCGEVSPHSTRLDATSQSTVDSVTGRQGRGPFHACPPEAQT